MEPIVFYDFKPDTEDPNNKIVIKKADFEKLKKMLSIITDFLMLPPTGVKMSS